jgi:hypothetical protein
MRISSMFGAKLSALNTVVLIPVPEHTSSADIQARLSRLAPHPKFDCHSCLSGYVAPLATAIL